MRKGIRSIVVTATLVVAGMSAVWALAPAGAETAEPQAAPESDPQGAAAGSGQVEMVDADGDAMKWRFEPAAVTVNAGTTVVWHNGGTQPHTVTANDKSFKSPYVSPGGEFMYTFPAAGEFAYFCEPHPWMKATVKVQAAPSGGSTPPSTAPPATPTTAAPAAPPTQAPAPSAPAPTAPKASAQAPAPTPAAAAAPTTATTAAPAAGAPAVTTTTAAPAAEATSEEPAAAEASTTAADDATEAGSESAETAAGPLPVSGGDDGDAGLLLLMYGGMAAVPVGATFLFARARS